ncbi:MAG TPA: POTRA domain-containing protein, partial [Synergistales bacterium]|nr:POTRA domain-containing protein [Synergistales bacterium]
MKRLWSTAVAVAFVLITAGVSFSAVQPVVVGVDVTGNQEVVSEHILGVVGTKAGDQLSSEQIQQDIDTIYGLGFFSYVDVGVVEQFGGVFVEFRVQENPVVQDIRFSGNTVFTADELMEVVFTRPGSVFNRVFFRHDLQRIGEKYEKAGYVLVRVEDVGIRDGIVDVRILEPKIGDIVIQGNKKTKTQVIRREFKLQPGDLFNATVMRHSLNKLNQMGFFEDVSVGLEPTEDPSAVNIILTVEEGKTARVGLTIGHGSESGWTGGAMYEEL